MKIFTVGNILRLSLFPVFFWASIFSLEAQTSADAAAIKLSLNEAIRYAKESNKLIRVLKTEENAAQLDLEDAKMGAMPRVISTASLQRYTKVTLYDGVLGESRQITKPPNANAGAVGVEASFNLYSGGRQTSVIADSKHKNELASINTLEQEANIGLQVAFQYLDLVKFYFQARLIKDQVSRAQTRLKNINALHANGKVTRSDVLRADVQLSNALLSEKRK